MKYRLSFSGRFNYRNGSGVGAHYHSSDNQLQLILSGTARVNINGVSYRAEEGDLVIIREGSRHEFSVLSQSGLKTLELKFINEGEESFSLASFPQIVRDRDGRLSKLFTKIISESQRREVGYIEMTNSLLVQILVTIARFVIGSEENSDNSFFLPQDQSSEFLKMVNSYILSHISKGITLTELATALGYNKDYIYRKIKRETGLSAVSYINSVRLEEAKSLLQNTDLSISEISWNLGFESLQYFSRFFKECTGESPSSYLTRVRETIRTDY